MEFTKKNSALNNRKYYKKEVCFSKYKKIYNFISDLCFCLTKLKP